MIESPSAVPVFWLLFPATLSLNGLSEFETTSVGLCRLLLLFPLSRPVLELLLPASLALRGETEFETTSTGLSSELAVEMGAAMMVNAKTNCRSIAASIFGDLK